MRATGLFLLLLVSVAQATDACYVAWSRADGGLDLGASRGVVALAAGDDGSAWAVADGGALWRSRDAGATWARVAIDGCAAAATVAQDPTDAKRVLVAGRDGGVWRSDDDGAAWSASTGAPRPIVNIAWSREDAGLVLGGCIDGSALAVSHDGGRTFAAVELGGEVLGQVPLLIDLDRWTVVSAVKARIRFSRDGGRTWADAQGDLDYFGGDLVVSQNGDSLFTAKHHGENKSVDGGATWQYAMEPHVRVIGGCGPFLLREGDRPRLRGMADRPLSIELSADLGQSWAPVTGGLIACVPADRQSAVWIPEAADPYAHIRIATAFAATPDARAVFLALGRAGVYRGRIGASRGGPILGEASVAPVSLPEADGHTAVTLTCVAAAKKGSLKRVWADASALGLGEVELLDDGMHGDGAPGDRRYGAMVTPPALEAGGRVVGFLAEDDQGRLSSAMATLTVASAGARFVAWDGERFSHGLPWVSPQGALCSLKAQTDDAHSPKVALELHLDGAGWMGGGWNWRGWYPDGVGDDVRAFRNLSFWVRLDAGDGVDVGGLSIDVRSANRGQTGAVELREYVEDLADGKWHEAVIPIEDLLAAKGAKDFDASRAWELGIGSWAPHARAFSLYLDDIGFDNRAVRAHSRLVTAPVERAPGALGDDVVAVAATVDDAADGLPISPLIYGIAMGDPAIAVEEGATIRRAGGNPVSPFDWRTGFGASGSDWYFANSGERTAPERTWLAQFHGQNRAAGLDTYLTLPAMGRVAKDGTSVAFDLARWPDQESWAGKAQPTDPHPNAGNGREVVKGADGKPVLGADGKPQLRDIEPDPDATSIAASADEQTAFLRFLAEDMKLGRADAGGVRYVALDNEPGLWHGTHRGMHPVGCGYDELWQRTRDYATALKRIDPHVRVAGPTAWGWTEYFYSGLDSQRVGHGDGTWTDPPDYAAHGRVPLIPWLLDRCREHELATGVRPLDILDVHFYPQTGIYGGGKRGDPAVMESRVQETRVLWDPTWVDPTWMGDNVEPKHVIRLIPRLREWIRDHDPGLQLALGEYSFGGDDDASGGVAQVEALGVFAREGVDFAFFWFAPAANSSPYFGFKLLRNPDGKHSAVGDRCLPTTVDHGDDVSLHAYRDAASGRLSLVAVNRRAHRGARIAATLARPVPTQDAQVWEYGLADRWAIARLPALHVDGATLTLAVPPLSAQRIDLTP